MSRVGRLGVVVAVAVGGAFGTVLRYQLALAEPVTSGSFPRATFAANVVGALLLGVVLTVVVDGSTTARYLRGFAAVGFCGGLTTFSTWMVESVLLVRDDAAPMALLDVGLSLVAGGLAVALGVWVTRAVVHRADVATFDPERED